MRYRDKGLTYDITYELADDAVVVESRAFSTSSSQRFSLDTLSANVTRQSQRNQKVKNALLIAAVAGLLLTTFGGLLVGERLLNFSAWSIFVLIAICLAIALFGLLNPWRDHFVGFHNTSGTLLFWIRRANKDEFESFVAAVEKAVLANRG